VMLVPDYRIADFDDMMRNGWPDADPRRIVLLEHPPAGSAKPAEGTQSTEGTKSAEGAQSADGSKGADGAARILRYANTEIDVEVDAPAGGFLVVNDSWHPWWRADIGGQPTTILKANVLFRAVQVAPGRHHVHFEFEPLRGAWAELQEKVAAVAAR
jgi:hypothetical protein